MHCDDCQGTGSLPERGTDDLLGGSQNRASAVPDWAPLGIMVGMSVGDIVGAIVAVSWFLRGTWRASVVDSDAGVDVEE